MKNIKNYYMCIFISTITRNIIDVYSVVYLYQLGFNIKDILLIYMIVYFLGIFFSEGFIILGNKIGYKYILMLSSVITGVTFYIIRFNYNLYLISVFLAVSIFTYHPVRHYYGIRLLKEKKKIGKALILIYVASLLSSLIAIKNISFGYLLIISFIGIIPTLFIKKEKTKRITYPKIIVKSKLNFFIFDQFKILFILLEPLYLYLIASNISYVGIFNIVLTISSVICIYLLVNKIDISKYYKSMNIIFTIILILKINILDKRILLIIALLEGIGIKINELVSTMNFYDNVDDTIGYLILSEKIFCIVRVIILFVIYLLPINFKLVLYFLTIGIFILSFQYKKDTT